jgi:signal peptidase II
VRDSGDERATGSPDAATPRRRVGLLWAVALVVAALDVVTKIIVVARLTPGESVRILGGLVYFSLIRNSGAAFGLANGMTVVFALVAAAVAAAIIRLAPRLRSVPWAVALGLVLGGATGNLIDRVFRAPGFLRGRVVDYISLFGPDGAHFPAFNVADSALTLGVCTLVVTSLLGIGLDGSRDRDAGPTQP